MRLKDVEVGLSTRDSGEIKMMRCDQTSTSLRLFAFGAACLCAGGCGGDGVGQSPYYSTGSVTGQGGAITGQGGAITGQGGVITGQGGAITGQGGAITGQGGAITGQGGVITGQGGVITGQGGAITGQGGVITGQGGGAPMGGSGGGGAAGGECDISGRWLATEHLVTSALIQEQTAHNYVYYEIGRDGDGHKIVKGMYCGNDAAATGLFAVQVDFSGSQASSMAKVNYVGRPVTSTKVAGGCNVHLGKWYIVRAATLPHYLDPSVPLPKAANQAAGSTPGWEDWDGDGKPGLTGTLTGTVRGRIFVAPRQWTDQQGTVPSVATTFSLAITWDQEQNVMAYDPPTDTTLGTASVRAGNPALHFVEFARLSAEQTAGDDAAICTSVRTLAKTLTPRASAI
jgi:hypothetical protein